VNRPSGRARNIKAVVVQFLDVLKIRQRIAHKIGYGYALALGSAIAGTSLGLALGNYYSHQAQNKVSLYTEKQQLLNELNSQILSIQMHPLRLLAVSGDSIWRQYETNQFRSDLTRLNELLKEIKLFANTHTHSIDPNQPLKGLSNQYQTTLGSYETFTQSLWQQLDNATSKSNATERLSAELSNESASQISLAFEQLSEDLIRVRQTTQQEQQQAEIALQQAELLRLTIILTSLTLSVGLAITLALITSRTIAKPIERVTTIAQQVTDSANFEIQIPIQTQDEVALLAKALNQLISWAGEYTQQLQQARNTLEQRVQERTQALRSSETQLKQKAEDLQATLTELQQTQIQLIESEKMSSLGQMVAGIAHEINNPVGFIHSNLQHSKSFASDLFFLLDLYQQHYPHPTKEIETALEDIDLDFMKEDFPNLMESMRIGTLRIKEIVLSLRTFSRLDEAEVKAIDIHESLNSTLSILHSRMTANQQQTPITLVKKYGDMPLVECYAGQMNQVFMHVLNNAIDALEEKYTSPKAQEAKIETHHSGAIAQLASPRAVPTIEIVTQVVENNAIAIQITDNGPGISEAAKGNLFDPFFTTKKVGDGTGMGLSTSHQIVTQRHNGQISFTAHPDRGTTFTIQIPIKLA